MKVFKIKTGNPETYKNFNDLSNSKIIVEHLIQYENEIKIGAPVFFMFGGDSTPWENGLAGICRILSLPIDLGYETAKNGKYYKLELEIIIRLSRHFTKTDFIKYPETYDTGIGPSTKGERNQALGIIDNTKAISAICRAIFDSEPDTKQNLITIFGNDIIEKAINETIVLYPLKADNNKSTTETLSIPLENILEEKTEDELYKLLGKALNDEYLSAAKTNQAVAGIHYFGLKYRKIILEHNLNENKIIENAPDVKESFYYELNKAKNIYLYAKEKGNIIKQNPKLEVIQQQSTLSTQTPTQIIFYGVPGSGKSHSIKNELVKKGITDLKEQTKRVVFHPEYTNADFVGQILPQSSDGGKSISYPFVPGPFTQILAKAYTHQNTHYALIIEEINRGNAAAIFGELFQLLDRLDEDETESSNEVAYTKGWSSYSINNDNINKSIQEAYEIFKSDLNFEPFINKEKFDTYKLNIGIRLPPNLSIFATMNTSDQNVFKLDNAFKRRWELKLIPNKFKEKLEPEEKNQRDAVVEGFDFTWNNFREAVNSIIIDPDNSIDISSFADRQIGCWFTKAIKKDEKYIIEKEVFVYKVLEYLWDDVCNGDIGIFFKETYKSFVELVEDVIEKGITDIFSENLKVILSQNKTE